MEILTKLRKVGNSAAVIIPKAVLEKEGLNFKDKVSIIILPRKTLGQVLWNKKSFKRSADELKRLVKRELRWE